MAQVTLTVSGTPYQFTCQDGEEERLRQLAGVIDEKVGQLEKSLGRVGDAKLLLMAALLLLDEASDEQDKIKVSGADLAAHVSAIDSLAGEIENIAARLENT